MIRFVRVKKSEDLREYLLDHGGLSQFPDKGINETVNISCFKTDLEKGELGSYCGEWVAYHKGVLCGHSVDGENLYGRAKEYYGKSNLAVFRVPQKEESLENTLQYTLGEY